MSILYKFSYVKLFNIRPNFKTTLLLFRGSLILFEYFTPKNHKHFSRHFSFHKMTMLKSHKAKLQLPQQWDDITITIQIKKPSETNISNDDNIEVNLLQNQGSGRHKELKKIEQPLIQNEITKMKQHMEMMKVEMK